METATIKWRRMERHHHELLQGTIQVSQETVTNHEKPSVILPTETE
jgi:hypothetical protein